jgi:hypothetical protein
MKPKKLGLILLTVAFVGIVGWFFMHAPPHSAVDTHPVSAVLPAAPPAASPIIAPSFTPSAPLPGTPQLAVTPPVVALPSAPVADPQTDLKTAIADIARLWRAGQRAQMYQTYSPPGQIDPVILKALTQIEADSSGQPLTPQKQQMYEKYAQCYDDLEGLTPTYNALGDEATYPFTRLGFVGGVEQATQGTITFVKINGKWYIVPIGKQTEAGGSSR